MNDMQSVQDMVMLAGDRVVTDSRKVAQHFGKEHGKVLRSIRNIECSKEFRQANFGETVELRSNPSGGAPIPSPIFTMTKDGFMFMVMGFTGAKAAAMKEAFIEAFNRMAEFIRQQASSAWERWNAAYLEYRHEAAHASRCGKDLNQWKGRKPEHQKRLSQLDPQLTLFAA